MCTYFGRLNFSTRFDFRISYTYLKNADAIIQNQFSQINKCTCTRFSLKVTFLQFSVSQLCSIVYFVLNKNFWFWPKHSFFKFTKCFSRKCSMISVVFYEKGLIWMNILNSVVNPIWSQKLPWKTKFWHYWHSRKFS